MAKKTIRDIKLAGRKVLMRCDFNVPLDDQGSITDDTRIRAALPTIHDLIGKRAKVILSAHFGRPKGQVNEAMRLTPVANRLGELLGQRVVKTESCRRTVEALGHLEWINRNVKPAKPYGGKPPPRGGPKQCFF